MVNNGVIKNMFNVPIIKTKQVITINNIYNNLKVVYRLKILVCIKEFEELSDNSVY